ncbi:hypothetical protein D3C81_1657580 [compost metagenome]
MKLFHLSFDLGDFLFQQHNIGPGSCWFLPIGSIECRQVTVDIRFNFFHSPFHFGAGVARISTLDTDAL